MERMHIHVLVLLSHPDGPSFAALDTHGAGLSLDFLVTYDLETAAEHLHSGQINALLIDYAALPEPPMMAIKTLRGLAGERPLFVMTDAAHYADAAALLPYGVQPSLLLRQAPPSLRDTLLRHAYQKHMESLCSRFFGVSSELLCLLDLETEQLQHVNPAVVSMLAYAPAQLVGRRLIDFIHPDDRSLVREILTQPTHDAPVRFEARMLDRRGVYHWMQWALQRREGLLYLAAQDMSTHQRVAQALAASESRLRVMLSGLPMPAMLYAETARGEGEVLLLNAAWTALSGYNHEDLPTLSAWGSVAYDPPVPRPIMDGETTLRSFDGHQHTWDLASVPLGKDPDGRRLMLCIATDITRQREAERGVQNQAQALRRCRTDQEQIAAALNGELRLALDELSTRLTGVDAHCAEQVAAAREALVGLQAVINALLGYFQHSAKSQGFDVINCDRVLQEVVAEQRTTAEASGAHITWGPLPALIADREGLAEVFRILVGNALKYVAADHPPQIHIHAQACGSMTQITVQDNGPGIPRTFLSRAFEPFTGQARGDVLPGVGMGLATARHIVERHGGRIWAESTPGKGTRVMLTLPTHTQPHSSTSPQLFSVGRSV